MHKSKITYYCDVCGSEITKENGTLDGYLEMTWYTVSGERRISPKNHRTIRDICNSCTLSVLKLLDSLEGVK